MTALALQGAGVGLRTPHVATVLDTSPAIPWFELLADNWFAAGGLNRHYLQAVTERYPCVLHGVGLSLGALDPLNFDYLAQIRQLKQQTGALWYSEHCSFSVHNGLHIPDLLPLPYTSEAVAHISTRIQQVQDFMGERLLLENVSSYLSAPHAEMTEGEFICAVAEDADCDLLLDINNSYVSEVNNHQDCRQFLDDIPVERVRQIHLAGYEDKGGYLIDAHNNPVTAPVWQHFADFIAQHGQIPTLIEWDNDLPELDVLLAEQQQAQTILDQHAIVADSATGTEMRQCF